MRGPLAELAAWAKTGVRGEIVVVVAGAALRAVSLSDAVDRGARARGSGTRMKEAAAEVRPTGLSSRDLYQAALAVRNG